MTLKTNAVVVTRTRDGLKPVSASVTADVLAAVQKLIDGEEREAAMEARRLALVGPAPGPRVIVRDRNGVQVALLGDDGPTPERLRHAGGVQHGVLIGKEKVPAARVEDSTPLRKYLRDKAITADQFRAGLFLHSDFMTAGIKPRVIGAYQERVSGSGGWDNLSAAQSAARRRYVEAMAFVHYRFRPVLVHVACLGFTASDWAATTGRRGTTAQAVGMETLRYGLDDLAAWYRLIKRS